MTAKIEQTLIELDQRDIQPDFLTPAKRGADHYEYRGRRYQGFVCPACGNGSGAKGDGLRHFIGGDGLRLWQCFGKRCRQTFDFAGLWCLHNGKPNNGAHRVEAAAELANMYGLSGAGGTSSFTPSAVGADAYQDCVGIAQGAFDDVVGMDALPMPSEAILSDSDAITGAQPMRAPAPSPEPVPDHTAYIEACAQRAGETDYFRKRGISAGTVRRYRLGFDPERWRSPVCPAVVFPMIDSQGVQHYKYRFTDRIPPNRQKAEYSKGCRGGMYRCSELTANTAGVVIVTEGEFDCLSVLECGGMAVCLSSASNKDSFVQWVRRVQPRNSRAFRECVFVVSLDNDDAGQDAAKTIKQAFDADGRRCYVIDLCGKGADGKPIHDINDQLLADRAVLADNVASVMRDPENFSFLRERCEYRETFAVSDFDDFLAQTADAPDAISTGFSALDKVTGGGLRPGVWFYPGMSSCGKSALLGQIAYNLCAAGHDVIFCSLEMSKNSQRARDLSRLTYIKAMRDCGAEAANTSWTRQALHEWDKAGRYDKGGWDGLPWRTAHAWHPRGALTEMQILTGRKHFDEWQTKAFNDAVAQYRAAGINNHLKLIEAGGGFGVKHVRQEIETYQHFHGTAPIVVIDYMQLLAGENKGVGAERSNNDANVLELRRIARDTGAIILAPCSINRMSYGQEGLTVGAIKESGGLEFTADVVQGLQDADYSEAGKAWRKQSPAIRELHINVMKNRFGVKDILIPARYNPAYNYFEIENWKLHKWYEVETLPSQPSGTVTTAKGRSKR